MTVVELCRVETQDGLLLDGALHSPRDGADSGSVAGGLVGVDAVLLLHGTGSHFYAGGVLEEFAVRAAASGVTAVRVNTRGHDPMTRIPGRNGSTPGGAAYENVSECPLDIAAWLVFLESRGMRRVLLVGHSMGGVKAIYAATATKLPETVVGVVAISAPRFHHAQLATRPAFVEDYERAVELVEAGHGETLVRTREPLPLLLTASGVVAKYGTRDDYDIVRHIPSLSVPALYIVGTESARTSVAFETIPTDLAALVEAGHDLTVEIVEGANTIYADCADEPFNRAWAWIKQRFRT